MLLSLVELLVVPVSVVVVVPVVIVPMFLGNRLVVALALNRL
jgi:hypothetical protein